MEVRAVSRHLHWKKADVVWLRSAIVPGLRRIRKLPYSGRESTLTSNAQSAQVPDVKHYRPTSARQLNIGNHMEEAHRDREAGIANGTLVWPFIARVRGADSLTSLQRDRVERRTATESRRSRYGKSRFDFEFESYFTAIVTPDWLLSPPAKK